MKWIEVEVTPEKQISNFEAASFAQRNGSASFGGLSRARPSFFDAFDIASSQQQSTGMFRPNPRAADNIKFVFL